MLKKSLMLFLGLFLLASIQVHAATINGGSLLTQSYANQLENWLGGSLNSYGFKILFDSSATSYSAAAFHSAANGKGATITVIKDTNGNIFGGYNSNSWSSVAGYHTNPGGFIFNLTNNFKQGLSSDTNRSRYGTYDNANNGPTFGGGHDIYVAAALGVNSYVYRYSYGNSAINILGNNTTMSYYKLSELEVYTIGQPSSPVPIPSALYLLAPGLLGLIGFKRKYL